VPSDAPTTTEPTLSPTEIPTIVTTESTTSIPTGELGVPTTNPPQSTSSKGDDTSDSSTIIIVVLAVLLVGVTLFFVLRDRSKTSQGRRNNQPLPRQPVYHDGNGSPQYATINYADVHNQPANATMTTNAMYQSAGMRPNVTMTTNAIYKSAGSGMRPNQMYEAADTSA